MSSPNSSERKLPSVLVVTGATRSGKTSIANYVASKFSGERVLVISQDDDFKKPSNMPKVSLQGAPYIKVAFWDKDECVDWDNLQARVNGALHRTDADAPTLIVIEGHMLLTRKFFYDIATHIICISVDKWKCFERRVNAGGKRQCYLPYMIEMWKEHQRRFGAVLNGDLSKIRFVDTARLFALDSVRDMDSLLALGTTDPTEFARVLLEDAPYPRGYVPFDRDSLKSSNFAADVKFADSALGMLFGNALGDAAGAPFEFHRGKQVNWNGNMTVPLVMSGRGGVRAAAPGAITDDFQMTLLALKCLIKNNMRFVGRDHAMAYVKWASSNPGGIGINTRALFQHAKIGDQERTYKKYLDAFAARHADKSNLSRSNGTLMRASAFAVIPSIDEAIAAAVGDCALSNDNVTSKLANAVYVCVLHRFLHRSTERPSMPTIDGDFLRSMRETLKLSSDDTDASLGELKTVDQTMLHAVESPQYDADLGDGDMFEIVNSQDKKGFVLAALWVAFRSLKRNIDLNESIGDTLRRVVNFGGDTDTNAAITGALLGAYHGFDKLKFTEAANFTVLMNVQYDYCTIKNVDNLTPRQLPTVFQTLFQKLYSSTSTNTTLDLESPSISSSSSTSKRSLSNDDDGDDDDETEDFDVESVRKEKRMKSNE